MMRALFRMPSVVADYTVGTVIVLVHTLRQERRSRPALPAASKPA